MRSSQPDKSIDDTGERMVPAYHKSKIVYGEHIVRYTAARELVKNKKVLDIASGSGYGTAELAKTAAYVTGVDVNQDAIAYAKRNYGKTNVNFILGDGVTIPLDTDSVDVVVSFETIEHIEDYKFFLKEVERVLKPDGLFVLSTPNDVEFPEGNHYHIHEFKEKELVSLVKRSFKTIDMYYQGTWLYNALLPINMLGSEWEDMLMTMQTAPIKTIQSVYFYLLCSNNKKNPHLAPLSAISEHYSARSRELHADEIRHHMDEQQKNIERLEAENGQLIAERERLKKTIPGKVYRKALAVKRRLSK